jgi:hypothetical protein
MKQTHADALRILMDSFLEDCDSDGGNPEWCYEELAEDMAKAAELVYDSCMRGQDFAADKNCGNK